MSSENDGIPMSQTAKELGIGAELLRRWVKEYGVRSDASRGMTPEGHVQDTQSQALAGIGATSRSAAVAEDFYVPECFPCL